MLSCEAAASDSVGRSFSIAAGLVVILVFVCVYSCMCMLGLFEPHRGMVRLHLCLSVGYYMFIVLFFPLVSRVSSWGALPDGSVRVGVYMRVRVC